MNIRMTRLEDLSAVVECHKRAFPEALSSKLGNDFIHKMLEWYIISDRGVLFHVADENGTIQGYCGGIITLEPGLLGASSSISQYAFTSFIWSYAKRPWVFFHPDNYKRVPLILRNIAYKMRLKTKHKSTNAVSLDAFIPFMGLVVIGADPASHGKGYGSAMLQEFEARARIQPGVMRIQLTVKSTNEKAILSYLRNGWIITSDANTTKTLIKSL
jgi:ribosomal protein S18 acetylase RimI-like enzyme